jgi:hypothetical protein
MSKNTLGPFLGTAVIVAVGLGTFATEAMAAPQNEQAQNGPETIFDCMVIDEEGSYVLANNLPSPGGSLLTSAGTGGIANDDDCLVLTIDKVSINGSGFTITGPGEFSGTSGDGIRANFNSIQHATIRNVTITGFHDGIELPNSFFAVIENVNAINNANSGIDISGGAPGQDGRVTGNNAVSNGGNGIWVGSRSIVTDNISNGNDNRGFWVNSSSLVTGNIADANDNQGIFVWCPGVVLGNMATGNGTNDIELYQASDVCVAANNLQAPVITP